MNSHPIKTKSRIKRRSPGRIFFSALLLSLVLLQSLPIAETLAHSEMECCKGMAKMSPEACAGGFCMTKKAKRKPKRAENICGGKKLSPTQLMLAALDNDRESVISGSFIDQTDRQAKSSQLASAAVTVSCKSDCCATTVNIRNRSHFTVVAEEVSMSEKPRPPTRSGENNYPASQFKAQNAPHRECRPRAPPRI